MMTFRNRSIAALGAVVATFATVSASAPAHAETFTAEVHYGDLDLNSPADIARLRHRVHAAADEVCGPQNAMFRVKIDDCRRDAIARAEASIATRHMARLAQR